MSDVTARERLIVALDQNSRDAPRQLVRHLGDAVSFYKVGWVSLLYGGTTLVEFLREEGKQVFLDLKIFDVPHTVQEAVKRVSQLGARFTTVHGNQASIAAAMHGRGATDLKILAVTALTSLSERDIRDLYSVPDHVSLEQHVLNVTKRLVAMGCDGVIASPQEIAAIREAFPDKVLIVAPGIRLPGEPVHDHIRFGRPYESTKAGADYLVVGRSIYTDSDPRGRVEKYIENIARGLEDRGR